MGVPAHFFLMATLALQNAYLLLCWPSRMHIYGTVGPPECIFMALQVLSNNRGTSAFFTTFQTYSNVDTLECIFMAPLAIFTLWRYPQ